MSHSQALGTSVRPGNELVRGYLKTAGERLDALQAGSEADQADVELIWAIRDIRWAVHHLLEIVEAYRDAS